LAHSRFDPQLVNASGSGSGGGGYTSDVEGAVAELDVLGKAVPGTVVVPGAVLVVVAVVAVVVGAPVVTVFGGTGPPTAISLESGCAHAATTTARSIDAGMRRFRKRNTAGARLRRLGRFHGSRRNLSL
jgi:hypothetical protein